MSNSLNIFVQSGGRIKILDFGPACPVGTETYEFFGMMSYNAPEQISGDPGDARTDIYSLAVLAYEMLTGTKPFDEFRSKAESAGMDCRISTGEHRRCYRDNT
ncbi:MAG: protein kinase [Desulfobacterales bacterium]|nr:protein kinase [Desulfobacterales bacterium]